MNELDALCHRAEYGHLEGQDYDTLVELIAEVKKLRSNIEELEGELQVKHNAYRAIELTRAEAIIAREGLALLIDNRYPVDDAYALIARLSDFIPRPLSADSEATDSNYLEESQEHAME